MLNEIWIPLFIAMICDKERWIRIRKLHNISVLWNFVHSHSSSLKESKNQESAFKLRPTLQCHKTGVKEYCENLRSMKWREKERLFLDWEIPYEGLSILSVLRTEARKGQYFLHIWNAYNCHIQPCSWLVKVWQSINGDSELSPLRGRRWDNIIKRFLPRRERKNEEFTQAKPLTFFF